MRNSVDSAHRIVDICPSKVLQQMGAIPMQEGATR